MALPDVASGLQLIDIDKSFGTVLALRAASLSAAPGEILAVTGPSGAGKTTLCRVIAGLERPDRGRCRIGGRDATAERPGRRHVAYMFESYALYPHLSVRENVLSPLIAPGGNASGSGLAEIDEMLALLEIGHLKERLPSALSGGQKQRVALARTLVQSPAVTLLDEPISHLDAKLRHTLRGEIRRLLSARPSPTLWCTPDGVEALSVGDRVAVIDHGRLEQIGTPEEVWTRPASVRVARLLGDPPMNLLSGRLAGGAGPSFAAAGFALALPPELLRRAGLSGQAVTLGVRPELLRLGAPGRPGSVVAEVYSYEPFGKHSIVTLRLGTDLLKAKIPPGMGFAIGAAAGVEFPSTGLVLFDGETGLALSTLKPEERLSA